MELTKTFDVNDKENFTHIASKQEWEQLQAKDKEGKGAPRVVYFTIGGNHGREGLAKALAQHPPPSPIGQALMEAGLMCRIYFGLTDDEVHCV